MRIADLDDAAPKARDLVPEALARRHRILPLRATATTLQVASSDPNDLDAERAVAFATGRNVDVLLAAPGRIARRIDEVYRPESVIERILEGVSGLGAEEPVGGAPQAPAIDHTGREATERPIVRLVDFILLEGIKAGASDIHVEPAEGEIAVRYRIDGVLRQVLTLPRACARRMGGPALPWAARRSTCESPRSPRPTGRRSSSGFSISVG
jgi:type II secretory ATPase GspE/PulE/Tfp pilus assembly ATPase PilB-like protein